MLRTMTKHPSAFALLFFVLVMAGCGGGRTGGNRMALPGSGLSMSAPAGWRLDRPNPAMCSKGDCTGLILDESLEGKDFTEHAKTLAFANSGSIVSEKLRTIGGCEAIEAVIEYANAGSKSLKVYIHKEDRLIEVSFVTPVGQFSEQEPAMRAAVESIKIQ